MQEIGVVQEKVENSLYRVKIVAGSENCQSCHMQKKCCSGNSEMLAQSFLELTEGDRVLIVIEEKNELLRAALVFLIPMVSGGIAACLSYFVAFPKNPVWCFGAFLVFMGLAFFLSGKLEKRMKRFFPLIVSKLNAE